MRIDSINRRVWKNGLFNPNYFHRALLYMNFNTYLISIWTKHLSKFTTWSSVRYAKKNIDLNGLVNFNGLLSWTIYWQKNDCKSKGRRFDLEKKKKLWPTLNWAIFPYPNPMRWCSGPHSTRCHLPHFIILFLYCLLPWSRLIEKHITSTSFFVSSLSLATFLQKP